MQLFEFFVKIRILNNFVDEESEEYEMYLLLRDILNTLMRLEITEYQLQEMHEKICFFIKSYINLVNLSVIFKIHFMLHYKKFIQLYGPIWIYCT